MRFLKRLRWTFATLGLAVLGAGIYLALNAHWIRIESVQVDLLPSSNEDSLFQRIKTSLAPQLQHFSGKFFWEVPLRQVYELTAHDRRVRRVSVRREFPSRLLVEIEPQTPVLAYLGSDNRIYPVAADATLLPALSMAETSDIPVLRGEELKDEQRLREIALDLFEAIPEEGTLRKKNVSEIFYTKKEGFKIFTSGSAVEVKMGETDFRPKLSRVEKVLSYLDSQNIKGRVIDARFSKKVVVRVRNTP